MVRKRKVTSQSKAKSSRINKKPVTGSRAALDPVTETARQLALPAYKDAVKPFASQMGKAGDTVGGLVNALLAPIALSVYAYQQAEPHIKQKIAGLVKKRLDGLPEGKIVAPLPRIAVPAIQSFVHAIDDDEVAEMFANLIASSMNVDSATNVHPSFVQVINNLTSDEALVLKAFTREQQLPLIDVRAHNIEPERGFRLIKHNFSLIGEIAGCQRPELMPSYLDNLIKEGLIEVPSDVSLADDDKYEALKEHKEIKQLKEALEASGLRVEFGKKIARLTPYGQLFVLVSIREN